MSTSPNVGPGLDEAEMAPIPDGVGGVGNERFRPADKSPWGFGDGLGGVVV